MDYGLWAMYWMVINLVGTGTYVPLLVLVRTANPENSIGFTSTIIIFLPSQSIYTITSIENNNFYVKNHIFKIRIEIHYKYLKLSNLTLIFI